MLKKTAAGRETTYNLRELLIAPLVAQKYGATGRANRGLHEERRWMVKPVGHARNSASWAKASEELQKRL